MDQPCPALDELLQRLKLLDAAYITACNPRSRALTATENALRMHLLHGRLRAGGYISLHGQGQPTDTSWVPEPSLLALGLPRGAANRLAETFGQFAWLQHRQGAPSRLCFTALWPLAACAHPESGAHDL